MRLARKRRRRTGRRIGRGRRERDWSGRRMPWVEDERE
jgi:hypothetical protein